MADLEAENRRPGKQRGTPFKAGRSGNPAGKPKAGRSGNPAGKPKGSRNAATLAMEALLGLNLPRSFDS